uniref:Uncharacterized protein n=1 Tax=Lepeophtheirus salmonis TaxID=72036 RepID=A0A0K2UUR9_LEPSM
MENIKIDCHVSSRSIFQEPFYDHKTFLIQFQKPLYKKEIRIVDQSFFIKTTLGRTHLRWRPRSSDGKFLCIYPIG